MGLEKYGISLYQIVMAGCSIFFPLSIFSNMLPTFARQRIDYTLKVKGEDQAEEEAVKPPSFKESFTVVKHNRWFITNTIVNFVTIFTPKTDGMFFYRFLIPTLRIGRKDVFGMDIYAIKNNSLSAMAPFPSCCLCSPWS